MAFVIGNERAHTGIFTRGHLSQVVLLVLRIVGGVGVKLFEHIVDGILNDVLGSKGIHIVEVQLLVQSVKDVKMLGRFVIGVAGLRQGRKGQHDGQQGERDFLHIIIGRVYEGS